jgi:TRAP-type C4-dicarboxylate transport system permease small subunit
MPSGTPDAPESPVPPTVRAGGFTARLLRLNMAWCELLVLAMMLVIAVDVFTRAAFGYSWQMSEEIAGYLLVALVFCSLSIAARDGAMLRVDFLFVRLAPRVQQLLDRAYAVLGLAFVGLWTYQLGRLVWSSYTREMVSNSAYPVPLWIPQVAMPVGAALLFVALVAIISGRITVPGSSGSAT